MTPITATIQAFFSDRLAGQLQASPRTIDRLLPRHATTPAPIHPPAHRQAALRAELG